MPMTPAAVKAANWLEQTTKTKRTATYGTVAIVALEIIDQGVDVLILLLVLHDGALGSRDVVGLLLVKLPALNVRRQRRSAGGRVFGHWRGGCGR